MKSYNHFTIEERICIEGLLKNGENISGIARKLGRNKSSVSREIKRNSNQNGKYNSWGAYSKAKFRRRNSIRKPRIVKDSELYKYIVEKLNCYWPPEIIVEKWKQDHPNDRISFATIYRAIKQHFFEGITAKKNLRRRGKLRYSRRNRFNTIQPERTIHEWTNVIKERLELNNWEGDTVRGALGKGGLLTLADRKSRKLIAVLIKNFMQDTLYDAVMRAFRGRPPKSITFDNGSEFARFRDMERDLHTTIYFADPHSPWQRGSNENINDVLRFFFPKGFNFLNITQDDVNEVVNLINSRPRFCLGLKSPDEVFRCS